MCLVFAFSLAKNAVIAVLNVVTLVVNVARTCVQMIVLLAVAQVAQVLLVRCAFMSVRMVEQCLETFQSLLRSF